MVMTNKGHVYLVDDDHDIRFHLSDLLRQLGYGVSDFALATDFLSQAQRVSPAVLVLDMRMPHMNGLDVQQSLIASGWGLPIIYMSGESQSQEIIDAMKAGAIDFLWKPVAHTDLRQAIDRGLELDRQRETQALRLRHVQSMYDTLSKREKGMFDLMLQGHSNKHIAAVHGLMADTVKKHRAQILYKMQVDSLAALLAMCKDFVPSQDPP
jgi:FixJ family two-component response regulator